MWWLGQCVRKCTHCPGPHTSSGHFLPTLKNGIITIPYGRGVNKKNINKWLVQVKKKYDKTVRQTVNIGAFSVSCNTSRRAHGGRYVILAWQGMWDKVHIRTRNRQIIRQCGTWQTQSTKRAERQKANTARLIATLSHTRAPGCWRDTLAGSI